MKANNKINQELIDRKLLIDHDINEMVSNYLDNYEQDRFESIRYIRKELKRVHKGLKKYIQTGNLI
jgi:hypothetical protein